MSGRVASSNYIIICPDGGCENETLGFSQTYQTTTNKPSWIYELYKDAYKLFYLYYYNSVRNAHKIGQLIILANTVIVCQWDVWSGCNPSKSAPEILAPRKATTGARAL